jgi:predicted nucleotidyltransferase
MNELTRSTVERLRAHEEELRAFGIRSLSVFGSIARGEGSPTSDIDVAVRLGSEFARGGFEYFGKLERLRGQLAAILARPVDVIEEPVEAERLQRAIDRERVPAF